MVALPVGKGRRRVDHIKKGASVLVGQPSAGLALLTRVSNRAALFLANQIVQPTVLGTKNVIK
jgi:hypothetical protein